MSFSGDRELTPALHMQKHSQVPVSGYPWNCSGSWPSGICSPCLTSCVYLFSLALPSIPPAAFI